MNGGGFVNLLDLTCYDYWISNNVFIENPIKSILKCLRNWNTLVISIVEKCSMVGFYGNDFVLCTPRL